MVKKRPSKPKQKEKRPRRPNGFPHGRPPAVIDEKRLAELAACDYTMEELAAEFDVHLDTIYARFSESLKKGRLKGNGSLKRRIFAKAMEGDMGALIWLSKNRFGYRDKQPDEATQVNFLIQVNEIPYEKALPNEVRQQAERITDQGDIV